MNNDAAQRYIDETWDRAIVPAITEYIKIPNKSPAFDANWQSNGYMDQAAKLIYSWCKEHEIPGMQIEIIQLENKTPVILIEIPGSNDDTILLYGHFDKQPEMQGWDADLHPWKPVRKGDRLYGRGGADDGYAAFASLTAIKTLKEQNIPHARCVILIEGSEESGSCDLTDYIDALQDRIGVPSLVICLDSGCGNYEQLWVTTSLRGVLSGVLTISTLTQGIHSGMGSGIVPSCFRVLRQLLDRLEDDKTGDIKLADLHVEIPEQRIQQANAAAEIIGSSICDNLPLQPDVQVDAGSPAELLLRRTWKPALSIIGCDIPTIENGGNVTLPSIAVKISIRIAPTTEPLQAVELVKKVLESDPPHGAKVTFEAHDKGPGWNAPIEQQWLLDSLQQASRTFFDKDAIYLGEGATIPFMGMLGSRFPKAQFVITGLLGPESNAHGPNEFLHIPMGKKLTACVASVIESHFTKSNTKRG